jgi:hypothetical protein
MGLITKMISHLDLHPSLQNRFHQRTQQTVNASEFDTLGPRPGHELFSPITHRWHKLDTTFCSHDQSFPDRSDLPRILTDQPLTQSLLQTLVTTDLIRKYVIGGHSDSFDSNRHDSTMIVFGMSSVTYSGVVAYTGRTVKPQHVEDPE